MGTKMHICKKQSLYWPSYDVISLTLWKWKKHVSRGPLWKKFQTGISTVGVYLIKIKLEHAVFGTEIRLSPFFMEVFSCVRMGFHCLAPTFQKRTGSLKTGNCPSVWMVVCYVPCDWLATAITWQPVPHLLPEDC